MGTINEYTEQANRFLTAHGLMFKAVFIGYGPYWVDDKGEPNRNIYRLEVWRGNKRVSFRYGDSVANTENMKMPRAYDLLACITKHKPEPDFSEFCLSYGYDIDSRKAEKTYKAVKREWQKVSKFFTAEEIAELQEIT